MWRLRDAELNWVSTNILLMPLLRQLLIGMSSIHPQEPENTLHATPSQQQQQQQLRIQISDKNHDSLTAGVAARLVRGKSCVPGPPPNMMEITFFGSALLLKKEGTCKV